MSNMQAWSLAVQLPACFSYAVVVWQSFVLGYMGERSPPPIPRFRLTLLGIIVLHTVTPPVDAACAANAEHRV